MAVVIDDEGVVADLYRTLLRVFSLASRFTRIKIYDNVETAVRDLAPMVDPDSPAVAERELVRHFQRLRSERKSTPARTAD